MTNQHSVTGHTAIKDHAVREVPKELTSRLNRLVRTCGWPYVIAWVHRLCGIGLVIYVGIHILTLSALHHPEQFEGLMKVYSGWIFRVMELALAVPVIFHALNGGRLILFEVFGNRRDDLLIKWAVGLSSGYVSILALVMIMGNQSVSSLFFWFYVIAAAVCITWITFNRLHRSGGAVFWKLQRVTAAYMLLMVPAHMLFMHLNASLGRDVQTIIERIHHPFIKFVDLTLVLGILFHGGYGLFSIANDYLKSNRLRVGFGISIFLLMAILFRVGVKLILTL